MPFGSSASRETEARWFLKAQPRTGRPVYLSPDHRHLYDRAGPYRDVRMVRWDLYGAFYSWYGRKVRIKIRIPSGRRIIC